MARAFKQVYYRKRRKLRLNKIIIITLYITDSFFKALSILKRLKKHQIYFHRKIKTVEKNETNRR